jgi:nucleotide-binding universal stress UspA family protein
MTDKALDLAKCLAKLSGARLAVLHVLPELDKDYPADPASISSRVLKAELRMAADKKMSDLAKYRMYDTENADFFIAVGYPPEEILQRARWMEADLIVLGARGAEGGGRVGGVAEKVVTMADIPVLVAT